MVTFEQIEDFCRKIVKGFNPLKVLLFGTYATGVPTVHSDVDILVILPFEGRAFLKSLEILNTTNPEFPIDLLARRPEDIDRRYRERDPLIREAIDNGRVLYERND
jgi:predicted nucleotidyltransferase